MAGTIKLERAGDHASALRIVDTNEGKRIMDQVRGVIANLQRAATTCKAPHGARPCVPS